MTTTEKKTPAAGQGNESAELSILLDLDLTPLLEEADTLSR